MTGPAVGPLKLSLEKFLRFGERNGARFGPALRGVGRVVSLKAATWLILPVVICLSQRLSHACLSINCLYCETANGSLNQL